MICQLEGRRQLQDCVQQFLQHSCDHHTENLDALIVVLNMIKYHVLGYDLLYSIYLIYFHMNGFMELMFQAPFLIVPVIAPL